MSQGFTEQWAELVRNARSDQSARMSLASAGSGGNGGGKQKLHVTPGVLRGRAGAAEGEVTKSFTDAQKEAVTTSGEVPGTLKGFASDEALSTYLDAWEKKVKYVKDQLGADGVAGALRAAADDFGGEDTKRRDRMENLKPYKPGDVI